MAAERGLESGGSKPGAHAPAAPGKALASIVRAGNRDFSLATQAELWEAYRETRDPALRNRLVMDNLGLVYRIARQYAPLAGEAYEDMVQEGCLALIHAVERFRPEYGLQFSTYAYPVISGIMKNFLRQRRRLRGRARGELDDSDEGASETLVDPVQLEALVRRRDASFTNRVVERVLTESLLARIPPVEQRLLRQVFYDDLSQREVAERLARSASRISRILRRALDRLRGLLLEVQREEDRLGAPMPPSGSRLALLDDETGLFGPLYLERCLASAMRRAQTFRAPVTLAVLRVPAASDGGPPSLARVAQRIYRRVRAMDHVFRAGPRDLALIFPLGRDQTVAICNRIATGTTGVLLRYGLATYPEDAASPREMLAVATRTLGPR